MDFNGKNGNGYQPVPPPTTEYAYRKDRRPWRVKRRTLYRIVTAPLWIAFAYLLGAAFAAGILDAWAVLS